MKSFLFAAAFATTSLVALSSAQTLPNAPGKDVFEKACTACHGVEPVTIMKGDKSDWTDVVDDMIAKGAEITKEDKEKIVAYLAAAFPKEAKKLSSKPVTGK